MTEYVTEVLNKAGYHAVIESPTAPPDASAADAILQGEIEGFWLYGGPLNSRQKITVTLKLRATGGENLLWEKKFDAAQDKAIIGTYGTWGNKGQKLVTDVLNEILNQTAREFSSDGFQQKVKWSK